MKYFPEGLHKINSDDISLLKQLLQDSYSDDVLIPVFINMIHKENTCHTFKHPKDWAQMSDLEKGHLLVKVIFLKLLAVVDFCNFEFKEASSLLKEVEEFSKYGFQVSL